MSQLCVQGMLVLVLVWPKACCSASQLSLLTCLQTRYILCLDSQAWLLIADQGFQRAACHRELLSTPLCPDAHLPLLPARQHPAAQA